MIAIVRRNAEGSFDLSQVSKDFFFIPQTVFIAQLLPLKMPFFSIPLTIILRTSQKKLFATSLKVKLFTLVSSKNEHFCMIKKLLSQIYCMCVK
jgi:hypothetical protein